MITNGLLFILQTVMNIVLLPLNAIDIAINVVSSIPVFAGFLNVVVYLLPWQNILPLIIFVIAMFIFRSVIALIRTIWDLIPFI